MKVLCVVVLLFSLPAARLAAPPRAPVDRPSAQRPHKGGSWYFAENGHAVYCYGPVMKIPQPQGIVKVATFCQGSKTMVPLKD
jgi:hypothetical protein